MASEIPWSPAQLIDRNRAWAARQVGADADYFRRLVAQQTPAYLWIGCSDSRVPATEIVDLAPGEVFVHRNVANLTPPGDVNYAAVLQFAVEALKVQHILVVGHYGCGGVLAALRDSADGALDDWLAPVRRTVREHEAELEALTGEATRHRRLCELNVLDQVKAVAAEPRVQAAWATGRSLAVHGWCYDIGDGLINDLHCTVTG